CGVELLGRMSGRLPLGPLLAALNQEPVLSEYRFENLQAIFVIGYHARRFRYVRRQTNNLGRGTDLRRQPVARTMPKEFMRVGGVRRQAGPRPFFYSRSAI